MPRPKEKPATEEGIKKANSEFLEANKDIFFKSNSKKLGVFYNHFTKLIVELTNRIDELENEVVESIKMKTWYVDLYINENTFYVDWQKIDERQ
mgnify:CR=1 FL=1